MSDPLRNRSTTRLALLATMFFLVFSGAGAQQAYLVPYLRRVTDWSGVQAGAVIATVYASMMIFRVLNIYLFSSWSDRRFTVVGSATYLLFPLAMLATAFVGSWPMAMAAAAVWGAGGAMMWTGTTMQTLAIADQRRGRHGTGMGVLYAATHAGWLSGVIVLGRVYKACDDAHLYLVYALAAALTLMGIVVGTFLPATGAAPRERPNLANLLAAMARGRTLIAGMLQWASALAFGVVLGGLGDYVQDAYGPGWIWIVVGFYPGTRMVMSPVSGYLSDRVGGALILFGGFAAGAVGMALVAGLDSPAAMIVAAFALGLLSSTVPVVAAAMVGIAAEVKRRPLVYGIVFSWRDLGVVTAAVGVRILADWFTLRDAFGVFAGVFALCAVLSLLLRRFADQEM